MSGRRLSERAVLAGSSFFGLGYLPWAPGTWGTLGGLAIWYTARNLAWPAFAVLAAVVTIVAIGIADKAEALYDDHDVGHIVIDEVAGMLVTAIGVPWQWPEVLAAFVVFRVLDAAKPPPIRFFDEKVGGGFGVVIDDVVAGAIGCILLHLMRLRLGGWW